MGPCGSRGNGEKELFPFSHFAIFPPSHRSNIPEPDHPAPLACLRATQKQATNSLRQPTPSFIGASLSPAFHRDGFLPLPVQPMQLSKNVPSLSSPRRTRRSASLPKAATQTSGSARTARARARRTPPTYRPRAHTPHAGTPSLSANHVPAAKRTAGAAWLADAMLCAPRRPRGTRTGHACSSSDRMAPA